MYIYYVYIKVRISSTKIMFNETTVSVMKMHDDKEQQDTRGMLAVLADVEHPWEERIIHIENCTGLTTCNCCIHMVSPELALGIS